jgi:hypothetical protein
VNHRSAFPGGTSCAALLATSVAALLALACSKPAPPTPEQVVKRMSDRLAAAQTFSFATQEKHQRRRGGQVVDVTRSRTFLVRRPGALSFRTVGGELGGGTGTYDGQHVTLVWPEQKAYARVRMPDTIDAALDRLAERFNTPLPVADLLYSNAYDALVSSDSSGRYVGREKVGATECDHVAYTHARVDWELWVAVGEEPTPCRVVITSKGASGPLASDVSFSDWNLSATAPADAFAVQVPADYERIPVAEYDTGEEPAPSAPPATPAAATRP